MKSGAWFDGAAAAAAAATISHSNTQRSLEIEQKYPQIMKIVSFFLCIFVEIKDGINVYSTIQIQHQASFECSTNDTQCIDT